MLVTDKIIKEKFNEYNKLYFNNELPKCKCKTVKTFTYGGKFSFNISKWGGKKMTYKTLEVSENFDWDEVQLKNIIVHEMLHYYLAFKFKSIKEQMNHEGDFIIYMNKFNKIYDLNITIKNDVTNVKLAPNASKFKWWVIRKFI